MVWRGRSMATSVLRKYYRGEGISSKFIAAQSCLTLSRFTCRNSLSEKSDLSCTTRNNHLSAQSRVSWAAELCAEKPSITESISVLTKSLSLASPSSTQLVRVSRLASQQLLTDKRRGYSSTADVSTNDLPSPSTSALTALRERLANGGPSLADFLNQTGSDAYSVTVGTKKNPKPKPEWIKKVIPGGEKYNAIKAQLRQLNLHTVCEEAKCPNIGECWSGGETGTATATIMILGDTCTRGCRFCAVKTSRAPPPPDPDEPLNVSEAIAAWGLDYVVLTSVDRDDLPDQGSNHFAETIKRLKAKKPQMLVEALVPDFRGDQQCVERVATSGLDVFAHNIETVEDLQNFVRDRRATFDQSINVLKMAKSMAPPGTLTKTSIMLGCGETSMQVIKTMEKVRDAGVDVMTFGQYMQPTKKHMPVSEYVTPAAFEEYRKLGMEMGFRYVASGPLVRSSYKAGEYYIKSMIEDDRQQQSKMSSP